ncbi:single-stranded DNA-binding protein [Candidatus Kuenenbacteria bacterium HGW-Kuenenbacteria-1]|uniref:Single-stranded DNA-binding protein n=1 Tax=Candidatus Kuenenbacteria bacterium HGW-Kuenenbacteria-1 TaxID=2013812 RepID=A0A2N1UN73_9BACT|nr:MAG: single-stranded DNA-binding protein [Candidatus Kuenenbacteria bacterium HGW-Kuenenbacteria-1]
MNFNKAIIIGRITRNPEARTTPSGQTVTSFGIATNRFWTGGDGQKQEKVEFHNIVAWGKLAEICNQYLNKGQLVLIEGRIETKTWEGQDGVKKTRTEIIAENMQMGPRVQNAPSTESAQENNSQVKFSQSQSSEEEIDIKEIPF